jgi:hypothetical protein
LLAARKLRDCSFSVFFAARPPRFYWVFCIHELDWDRNGPGRQGHQDLTKQE